MAQPTKYPLWDTNQTAMSDPGSAREADGWNAPAGVPEKPPYQTFNHWMNNVYLWFKYLNEQGVAEWDTTITYAIGAYVVASDKKLYRALVSQSGNTPVGDSTNWQPVGDLINTLVSTDITRGLTAAQGKVLKDVQDILVAGTSPQATETATGFSFLQKRIIGSNGTDAAHDIDTTAGNFVFSGGDGSAKIGAFTKQIDATWAAGTAAGGLASAIHPVQNTTTYHYFALSNASGSVVDFGFDTSLTATNLLADAAVIAAGLTKYSRQLSVITDGSANILAFKQSGTLFIWDAHTTVLSIGVGSAPTSRTNYSVKTPAGIPTKAILNASAQGTTGTPGTRALIYSNPDQPDEVPSATAFSQYFVQGTSENENVTSQIQVITNTSSQIALRCSSVNIALECLLPAYDDFTLAY